MQHSPDLHCASCTTHKNHVIRRICTNAVRKYFQSVDEVNSYNVSFLRNHGSTRVLCHVLWHRKCYQKKVIQMYIEFDCLYSVYLSFTLFHQQWVILNSTEWTGPTINGFASAKDYGRGKLEECVIDKTQNLLQLTALSARMSSVEWDWFIRPRTMTFKAQGTDCMDINIFSVVGCQSSIKVAHETRVQIISDNPVVNDWQRCSFRYEEVPYIRPYSYIKLGFSWCQCALIERWSAFS